MAGGVELQRIARADGELSLERGRRLGCGDGKVGLLSFAPDSTHVLFGDGSSRLCVAPVEGGAARTVWASEGGSGGAGADGAPETAISSAASAPAARWIAMVTSDGELHFRWLEPECAEAPWRHLVTFFFPEESHVAASPDGQWLASADSSGLLQVHRMSPAPECDVTEVELGDGGPNEPVTSLAFGAGGRLAAGLRSGGVWTWTLGESGTAGGGRLVAQHPRTVSELAFDRTGGLLASSSWNGSVILSPVEGGSGTVRLRPAANRPEDLLALAFRDDEPELLGLGASTEVFRFSLDLDRLKTLACRAAGRDLSVSEAREYLGEADPPRVCPGLPRGVD